MNNTQFNPLLGGGRMGAMRPNSFSVMGWDAGKTFISFSVMGWAAGKTFMLWVQDVGKIRMLIFE